MTINAYTSCLLIYKPIVTIIEVLINKALSARLAQKTMVVPKTLRKNFGVDRNRAAHNLLCISRQDIKILMRFFFSILIYLRFVLLGALSCDIRPVGPTGSVFHFI